MAASAAQNRWTRPRSAIFIESTFAQMDGVLTIGSPDTACRNQSVQPPTTGTLSTYSRRSRSQTTGGRLSGARTPAAQGEARAIRAGAEAGVLAPALLAV